MAGFSNLTRFSARGSVCSDLQLDFKSGYRWRENIWSGDVTFGTLDGVDVKVPWELARMQHLIVLAWAQRLVDGQGTTEAPFARAFRNQALDFIATNPPRFGVNWRVSRDIGGARISGRATSRSARWMAST